MGGGQWCCESEKHNVQECGQGQGGWEIEKRVTHLIVYIYNVGHKGLDSRSPLRSKSLVSLRSVLARFGFSYPLL